MLLKVSINATIMRKILVILIDIDYVRNGCQPMNVSTR